MRPRLLLRARQRSSLQTTGAGQLWSPPRAVKLALAPRRRQCSLAELQASRLPDLSLRCDAARPQSPCIVA